MIKIYTVNLLVDAHILKGLLESQGIKCEVKGEYLFGARGEYAQYVAPAYRRRH